MNRNDLLTTAGETFAYAEDYIETKIELAKLEAVEKGSFAAANVIAGLVVAVLGLFALAFFTLALAFWIGSLLNSNALGLLIVGLIFLVIAIIIFLVRDAILTTPIMHALVKSFFGKPADKRTNTSNNYERPQP